jgi:hypothetical protein
LLNEGTGELTPTPQPLDYTAGQVMLTTIRQPGATDATLNAYGPDGSLLWTRPLPAGSSVIPAFTPGTRPGWSLGQGLDAAGEFLIASTDSLSLVDEETGEQRWTTGAACLSEQYSTREAVYVPVRNAYVIDSGGSPACTVDRDTGSVLDTVPIPAGPEHTIFWGLTEAYGYPYDSGPASAYDAASGKVLWTRERADGERWSFDGGYLVSRRGNRIQSIG